MMNAQLECDRIIQGDCLEGLGKIQDGTIDLVFADPPFNIGYRYDVYDDKRDPQQYISWSTSWMIEVNRVLKPNGAFWLAIGDDFAADLRVLAQRGLRFVPRDWVIWYYTFGVNCTKKFTRSHTHLFHFVKDADSFTFNDDAIRVPSARQLIYNDKRANPEGRLPDDTWILRPQDVPGGFTSDDDVWHFPRVCGTFKERAGWHGCQMPEQLLGRIIRVSSSAGDIVLDPFAGSGSTLITAKKLDRRYLGFELSREYAERIESRLKETVVGDALEGGKEPLVKAKA